MIKSLLLDHTTVPPPLHYVTKYSIMGCGGSKQAYDDGSNAAYARPAANGAPPPQNYAPAPPAQQQGPSERKKKWVKAGTNLGLLAAIAG